MYTISHMINYSLNSGLQGKKTSIDKPSLDRKLMNFAKITKMVMKMQLDCFLK